MQRATTGARYWIRLFLTVFAGAFAIIAAAQLLKGHTSRYSLGQGLLWGAISAVIFVAAQDYRRRKGRRCVVCEVVAAPPDPTSKDHTFNK